MLDYEKVSDGIIEAIEKLREATEAIRRSQMSNDEKVLSLLWIKTRMTDLDKMITEWGALILIELMAQADIASVATTPDRRN